MPSQPKYSSRHTTGLLIILYIYNILENFAVITIRNYGNRIWQKFLQIGFNSLTIVYNKFFYSFLNNSIILLALLLVCNLVRYWACILGPVIASDNYWTCLCWCNKSQKKKTEMLFDFSKNRKVSIIIRKKGNIVEVTVLSCI